LWRRGLPPQTEWSIGGMRTIHLEGTLVAIAGTSLVRLEEPLAALPPHAAERRFVAAMCIFSLSVESDAEYDDATAARFARALLIPREALVDDWETPDQHLAARLRVPVDQVAMRRAELEEQ
jgi:hypothetical protein